MATTTNINQNLFVGTVEQSLSSIMQFTGLMPKLMRPHPNLVSKIGLPTIAATGNPRAWDEDFTASGTVDYGERYLTPALFRDDWEIANTFMDDTWVTLRDSILPSNFLDPLMLNGIVSFLEKTYSYQRDENILLGDTASLTPRLALYDGLIKLMTNDANVKSVGNAAITAVNIKDTLELLALEIANRPFAQMGEVVFIMNPTDYTLAKLDKELFGDQIGYVDINRNFASYLQPNYAIVPINAMPKNHIIVTHRDNLRFGYNDSLRKFQVTNQMPLTHNNYTRITLGWVEAVNYMFPSEVVTYGLKAAN